MTRIRQIGILSAMVWTLSLATPAQVSAVPVAAIDNAQVKDDLFEGLGLEKLAAKAKESNEVTLDKAMLGMAAGKMQGGKYAGVAGKMDMVVVRNYEFDKEGEYSIADLDVLRKKLDANGWSHLVRNRTNKEVNDVCVKTNREGEITEMVILNAEEKELNLVHLRGRLSMNDIKKFGGAAGLPDNTYDADEPTLKPR